MGRTTIFDYILLLLAPLITYLFSNVQVFAPNSTYVGVHDASPAPADLLISSKYLEIYANHNLVVAFLISLSILSILHLLYFVYAFRQPPMPVRLLWKPEFEAHGNQEDEGTLATDKTTRRGVIDVLQNQLRGHSVRRSSLMYSTTAESDTSQHGDIELKELTMPRSAHIRDTTTIQSQRAIFDRRHRTEEDDDWKTVYCEE
jgi:hypothetical protein